MERQCSKCGKKCYAPDEADIECLELRLFWSSYCGGGVNLQLDFAGAERALHTLIWDNFWTYAYQVAIKLAHNGERGFEVLLPGPCDDNPNFNDKYKGAILVETLCRLAYIADPFEISRLTVTRASEVGGVPVCYPYLFPKHGMRNVALGEDKAYWFFVQTLIAQTLPLVELHTTERQKQQISDLSQYSPRMTAEVCKAALAAAVRAYHHQWDTEWCGFRVEHAEAGVWADGNHPT